MITWRRRGLYFAHAFREGEPRSLCGTSPLSVTEQAPDSWHRCSHCIEKVNGPGGAFLGPSHQRASGTAAHLLTTGTSEEQNLARAYLEVHERHEAQQEKLRAGKGVA